MSRHPAHLDRRGLLRLLAGGSAAAGLGLGLARCGPAPVGPPQADGGARPDVGAPRPDAAASDRGAAADAGPLRDGAAAGDGPLVCAPTEGDVLGPFHEPGAPLRPVLAADDEPGLRIVISGQVLSADDCRTPLAGALLDLWHADAAGSYHSADEEYRLRGQILSDTDGQFSFETVWPGRYLSGGRLRPAHIHYIVSRPGYAPLTTQMYFAGDPQLGANDPCFPTCRSDDPTRIVAMSEQLRDGKRVHEGRFTIFLRR